MRRTQDLKRKMAKSADKLFTGVLAISGYALIVSVMLIAIFVTSQALPAFDYTSPADFLTGTTWRPVSQPPIFGIAAFLVGSLLIVLWALVVGVPLGLACAVYMTEMASPRVRAAGRVIITTLAGIPSVVYGIVGLLIVAPRVAAAFSLSTGLTGFSAGLILGLMIVPTVTSLAEESLLSVPGEYREAALALGATEFEAFWTAVFPAARSGITAAVMLATGRALGETMTVLMVAGGRLAVPTGLFQPMRTMTALLASEINNAPRGGVQYSALFAAGLVLFVITLSITVAADVVIYRAQKRGGRT